MENQNREVQTEIEQAFKASPMNANVPRAVSQSISPVVDVSPKRNTTLFKSLFSTGSSATIFTTSATKDTYITTVHGFTEDSGAGNFAIQGVVNGETVNLLIFRDPGSLVAKNAVIHYFNPVKLDRNSAVGISNIAGNDASAHITGYEVDPY